MPVMAYPNFKCSFWSLGILLVDINEFDTDGSLIQIIYLIFAT